MRNEWAVGNDGAKWRRTLVLYQKCGRDGNVKAGDISVFSEDFKLNLFTCN